jgi:hypothetical protein
MSGYQIGQWTKVAGLILLKCDTHSEKMVTIGMGKQVRSMGYDTKYVIILLIVPNTVPKAYRHRDQILQWRRVLVVKKRDKEAEVLAKEILRAVVKVLHDRDDDEIDTLEVLFCF